MRREIRHKIQGDGSDSWVVSIFNDDNIMISAETVIIRPEGHADTLEQAYEIKKDLIDLKTQELIFRGFTFAGFQWSLSITAQINWSNIPLLPEVMFPIEMYDINGDIYNLTFLNRLSFYGAAVATKNSHLKLGNELKGQVLLLTTIEDILNFVDPRV